MPLNGLLDERHAITQQELNAGSRGYTTAAVYTIVRCNFSNRQEWCYIGYNSIVVLINKSVLYSLLRHCFLYLGAGWLAMVSCALYVYVGAIESIYVQINYYSRFFDQIVFYMLNDTA